MITFRGVDDIGQTSREFGRIVGYDMPKAKAWAEVRGWGDPAPHYCVSFRNGQVFRGANWYAILKEARAQYRAIEKLTGEPP
jgi:hypothetical protein